MRDWEQCYQDGRTPWDRGDAAPPLLETIARHGVDLWGTGTVLVPGCGLGHDVRALAAAGVPVVGLDLAPTAVAKARELPAAAGEAYEVGDFLDPAWREARRFTAIWEHTCFCAIDPALRPRYPEAAADLLDPGTGAVRVVQFEATQPGGGGAGVRGGAGGFFRAGPRAGRGVLFGAHQARRGGARGAALRGHRGGAG